MLYLSKENVILFNFVCWWKKCCQDFEEPEKMAYKQKILNLLGDDLFEK